MIETPQEDIQDLWAIYQNTKLLVDAQLSLISLLQTAMTTLQNGGTPDYSSIGNSGDGGGESWSFVSLQQRLNDALDRYDSLFKTMQAQRLLAVKATPGFVSTRVPASGIRNCW